jgi:hypothetical protein
MRRTPLTLRSPLFQPPDTASLHPLELVAELPAALPAEPSLDAPSLEAPSLEVLSLDAASDEAPSLDPPSLDPASLDAVSLDG